MATRQGSMDEERSLAELIGDMSSDLGLLVRKELELARAEITEEVRKAGKAGGMFGGVALTAYLAVVLLSVAVALGLSALMPDGLAFFLVGLAYAAAAAVLFTQGRKRMAEVHPVPEQTVETLKEDAQWVKGRTR